MKMRSCKSNGWMFCSFWLFGGLLDAVRHLLPMALFWRVWGVGVVGAVLLSSAWGQDVWVWVLDPHTKVFRDTLPPPAPAKAEEANKPGQTGQANPPNQLGQQGQPEQSAKVGSPDQAVVPATGAIQLRAARNEYEPAQIAIRSSKPLQGVQVELGPLRHEDGQSTIEAQHLQWNFVGYIPIPKNTPHAERLQIRKAPFEVPDPLLADRTKDLPAHHTQPVWITLYVPKDAKPGLYQGQVTVVAGQQRAVVPIQLRVDPFTLPDQRHLWVTNWFNMHQIAKVHQVEMWSDGFWKVLALYAQNMAEHRQNVVLVPWTLIEVVREENGQLSFDFSRFDRLVELFEKAGVAGRLEISHVGHGEKGWGSPVVLSRLSALDRKTGKRITLEPQEGLRPLLAALEKHLAERGWLEKSMIHVADEPILTNLASWREASAFVHQSAPRLRRIEAIETIDCSGFLEVWVPQLSHFERWRSAYERHRPQAELWYYICCNPHGSHYPNRFLDYPLTAVRVLHWINFTERLAGYLHWGWNFWGEDPFGPPSDRLPPGDTHVVYPGPEGPLNSLRWEIQRESLEDFEYLWLLTAKTAKLREQLGQKAHWLEPERTAMELARQVAPAITQWEREPARIMAVRSQVADEILALDSPPLLLLQVEPPAGSTLYGEPIALEVLGLTEAGAEVKVNGHRVELGLDGRFIARPSPLRPAGQLRIEVQHQGKSKTVVKQFTLPP